VSGRKEIVDLLRQRSRPYLFSNSVAPAIVAASLVVLDLLAESDDLRAQLRENTTWFRERMTGLGFDVLPGDHPIVPVMLGDAGLASRMADLLLQRGVYVIGFSYPVVPIGKARIRVQLSRRTRAASSSAQRWPSTRLGPSWPERRGHVRTDRCHDALPARRKGELRRRERAPDPRRGVGLPRCLCRRRPPTGAPMLFVRVGSTLFLHASSGAHMARIAARKGGLEVAVEVSILDALVLARSAFNHSVNYRAVVAHGTATLVQGAEDKAKVLESLMEKDRVGS